MGGSGAWFALEPVGSPHRRLRRVRTHVYATLSTATRHPRVLTQPAGGPMGTGWHTRGVPGFGPRPRGAGRGCARARVAAPRRVGRSWGRAWPRRHRAGGRARRRPLSAPTRRSSSPTRWCRAVFFGVNPDERGGGRLGARLPHRAMRHRGEQARWGRRPGQRAESPSALARLARRPRLVAALRAARPLGR